MSRLGELVDEIEAGERPLIGVYEEILDAALSPTEKKLVSQMYHYQKFQLATLGLLKTGVPDEFFCFGSVVDEDVNMRQGPGPRHSLIRRIGKGTPVIVMKYQGNWAHIQVPDGTQGHVFRAYVKCEMGD